MKEKKRFRLFFAVVIFSVFFFWAFAYFKTEAKPAYSPIYGEINLKNSWFLLPFIIINYWFLLKTCSKKKLNLKKIFFLGFLLILLVNSLKQNLPFYEPLTNPNDFYTDSLKLKSPKMFLAAFEKRFWYHNVHTRTHPPGPVIFHYLINKVFSSQIIANSLTIVLLSNLTLFVVYKIACFFNNQNKSFILLLLLSSPGFLLYSATSMDAICCLMISLSCYLILLLFKKASILKTLLAGLVFFLASFLTYAAVIVPLFSFCIILFTRFKNKKFIYSQFLIAIITILIYLLLFWTTEFEPIKTFFAARNYNLMVMPDIFMTSKRYIYSVSANFVEYIIFLGLPIFSLFLVDLVYLLKKRSLGPKLIYYLSFLIPMILLNVSGIYKTGPWSGETGRIWLFLTPLIIGGLKIKNKKILKTSALLSFGQTLIMQLMLYLYW